MTQVKDAIASTSGQPTAELAEALARAEAGVKLSRYYGDAVELARRLKAMVKVAYRSS